MMNNWCGIGRLTKDPVRKKTANGKEYVTFILAISDSYNKSNTSYIDCQIWGNRGKYMMTYGKKGMKISVSGGKFRTYINNDGVKVMYVEVSTYEIEERSVQETDETENEVVEETKNDKVVVDEEAPF